MVDGSEALLSSEETNALLAAMRSGAEESEPVENVDLASPERTLRGALRIADARAREIAESIDKLMLRVTGCFSSTEELPAEIVPYKVVRTSAPQGAAVSTFTTQDGAIGFLMVGPQLASFILDRRTGAPLGSELPAHVRQELSALDRRLLEPTMNGLTEVISGHWCSDPQELSPSPVLAQPADMPTLPQFEPLLQLTLRVVPTGVPSDQIIICFSAGTVTAKSKGVTEAKVLTQAAGDRERLVNAIAETEVEAVAVLGQVQMCLRDLLGLRRGDLLRLDRVCVDPIEVRVGDKLILVGMPVINHGNMAVRITATTTQPNG